MQLLRIVRQSDTSIITRIKANNSIFIVRLRAPTVRVILPLKQGLRLREFFDYTLTLLFVRVILPLKQGLRQVSV